MTISPNDAAVTVSDAMALARGALETVRLSVVGEVTGCTIKPGYKAVYFSLTDESAVMPCIMWRDAYDLSGVLLRDGLLVEVSGYFTAYAAKGRLQFQVRTLTIAGEGALRVQVAALARRLQAEGLMDPARKRPLPPFPERIGLVTSPRGKAVHDVVRTLRRRYPVAELVIAGVQVEGEGAVGEIVRGLEIASTHPGVEVVVLVRGGGSYEDLMPFNAEEVARAIVASPVPVVTGIGHEPDTTIADMVADLRASTPTAAAEAVSPDIGDIVRRIAGERRALARALEHVVTRNQARLAAVASRPLFSDPSALLGSLMQAVDADAEALTRALPRRLERDRQALGHARQSLLRAGLRLTLPHQLRLERDRERAHGAGRAVLETAERRVALAAARLDDLSPVAILGRGYAVCYRETGEVVRSAREVTRGERVDVRLARGRLGCRVEETEDESED